MNKKRKKERNILRLYKFFSSAGKEATLDRVVREGLSEEVDLRIEMESYGGRKHVELFGCIILGKCKDPEV